MGTLLPGGQIWPLPVFVNKVLLTHNHIHPSLPVGSVFTKAERSSLHRAHLALHGKSAEPVQKGSVSHFLLLSFSPLFYSERK